jgi:hypothetical protein
MTFLLNILHKDYSLLATDRKGTAPGPVTITSGKVTISMPGGAVIEGVKKIRLTKNNRYAVGFAGNTDAHGYLDSFVDMNTAESAVRLIRANSESYFDFNERDRMLRREPEMENHIILTFFDPDKQAFFFPSLFILPIFFY